MEAIISMAMCITRAYKTYQNAVTHRSLNTAQARISRRDGREYTGSKRVNAEAQVCS